MLVRGSAWPAMRAYILAVRAPRATYPVFKKLVGGLQASTAAGLQADRGLLAAGAMGARAAVKAAAALAAFVLICIQLVQLVSAQDVANPDVVGYWKLKLGNVAIPEEVARLVSRLTPSQVTLFQKAITSKSLLDHSQDASAATFCSDAGLLCTYDSTTKTGPLQDEDCNYVGGSDAIHRKAVKSSGAHEQSPDPDGSEDPEWNYKAAAAAIPEDPEWNYKAAAAIPEDPEWNYKAAAAIPEDPDWNYKAAPAGPDDPDWNYRAAAAAIPEDPDWNYKAAAAIPEDPDWNYKAAAAAIPEDPDWNYKTAAAAIPEDPEWNYKAAAAIPEDPEWNYKAAAAIPEDPDWNYKAAAAIPEDPDWNYKAVAAAAIPEDPDWNYKAAAAIPKQYSEAQWDRARHVYFKYEDMPTTTSGATVPARFFIRRRSSTSGAFLPRPLASALDSLPWPQFLQALRTPSASAMAATYARTLQRCQRYTSTVPGVEARSCARSLEDEADFVASTLQAEAGAVQAEVSGHLKCRSPAAAGSLEVVKVEKRSGSKQRQVLCHDLGDFAYTLQACHSVMHTELYTVTLKSSVEPGVVITNVMACHTQTKMFRANHIALQALGIKPGDSGVCHFTMPGVTAFYSGEI